MDTPRQYKYITPEVVKNANIEIRDTEDFAEKIKEVKEYNLYMKECRAKMCELNILRRTHFFVNFGLAVYFLFIVFASDMMFIQEKKFYIHMTVSIILVVVYLAVYFLFSFWKDKLEFFPNVLMSAVLLYVNWIFLVLVVFNIVICGLYQYKKGCLDEEMGYPLFCEINIERLRGKTYDK